MENQDNLKKLLEMMVERLQEKGLLTESADKQELISKVMETIEEKCGNKSLETSELLKPETLLSLKHLLVAEALIQKYDPLNNGLDKLDPEKQNAFKAELKNEIKNSLTALNNELLPEMRITGPELDKLATKIANQVLSTKFPNEPALQIPDPSPSEATQENNKINDKKSPDATPRMNLGMLLVDGDGDVMGLLGPSSTGQTSFVSIKSLGERDADNTISERLAIRDVLGLDSAEEAENTITYRSPRPKLPGAAPY